jgi:hypothetical protein
MGSYGDVVLECSWCGQQGKCVLDEYLNGWPPLTDVDGVGVLCDLCLGKEENEQFSKRLRAENAELRGVIVAADAEIALLRAQIVELRRPSAECPACVKLRSELAACRLVSDCAAESMRAIFDRNCTLASQLNERGQ